MHHVHEDITLGHRLRTRQVVDMTVHEVRYPDAWTMPSHAHARANLTFVIRGSIEEDACGEARLLRACDAVVKPAGTVHSNRCGPGGAQTVVIEFRDPSASTDGGEAVGPARYSTLRGPEVVRAAMRALDLACTDGATASDELQELVTEMFALAPTARSTQHAGSEPWLEEVRDLLHDGFAAPLRVHDLAAIVRRHPVYLARAFRRLHGCSVTAYRRRIQVCEAARRLTDGEESLASVALSSGFADQSHFCRSFRAALGVSPGVFRRSMQEH